MTKLEEGKHYWLRDREGGWMIGKYIILEEVDALDIQVEGFSIIGSTVTIPPALATEIRGPIEVDDYRRIR